MTTKDIDYSSLSETGRRTNNEDKAICERNDKGDISFIVAVADGMGGLKAGDVASEIVRDSLLAAHSEGFTNDFLHTRKKIETCISAANTEIFNRSTSVKGGKMGTTVSGAVIIGNRCLIFNIGDSRTYIITRDGKIEPITVDHSGDMSALRRGLIKENELGKGLYSHGLTRAVGTKATVEIDFYPDNDFRELNDGDIVFACTDGLWNKVTNDEIRDVIYGSANIIKSLKSLSNLALKNGSNDNISMAAYRYGAFIGQAAKKTSALTVIESKESKSGKKKKNLYTLLVPLIVAGFIIASLLIFLLNGNRWPWDNNPVQNGNGQRVIEIPGGDIRFIPPGGHYTNKVQVHLEIAEPPRISNGDPVAWDIYYTRDGSEPTKSNGTKYEGNEKNPEIEFNEEGTFIIDTRLFSRDGRYKCSIKPQQIYVIEKSTEPGVDEPEVTRVHKQISEKRQFTPKAEVNKNPNEESLLPIDEIYWCDNFWKAADNVHKSRPVISLSSNGITNVEGNKKPLIIQFSKKGEVQSVRIDGIEVSPQDTDKLNGYYENLKKYIQSLNLPRPTKDGNAVDYITMEIDILGIKEGKIGITKNKMINRR